MTNYLDHKECKEEADDIKEPEDIESDNQENSVEIPQEHPKHEVLEHFDE